MSLIGIAIGLATQVVGAIRENKAQKASTAAKMAANNVNAPAQAQQAQQPAANAKTIQDKIARLNATRAANPKPDKNMMYYVIGGLLLVVGLFFAFKKR